jgi:hypothetical protein
MSLTQVGNIIAIAAPAGKDINGGNDTDTGYGTANFISVAAIKARLTVINGAIFTVAYMNSLSYNDLIYALYTLGG